MDSIPPLEVLHSAEEWLPQTHTWMFNQVRFLPQAIDSHIMCEARQNADQFSLPNIHCLEQRGFLTSYGGRFLRKIGLWRSVAQDFRIRTTRRIRPDILHSNFGPCGWENVPVARRSQIPHVVSFYGADASRLPTENPHWRSRYSDLFAHVQCVLSEGPHLADCLVSLGCPREKIRIHHLGVCVEEIRYLPRHRCGKEPLRVLIAASFREKKGIPFALKALGIISRDLPIEITIIGDAAKGDSASAMEKDHILATIEEERLRHHVRLLGYQSHQALFQEAYNHHIFLSPSVTARNGDTEGGLPVTLIEMAATGMPVVATRHCDIPEAFPDGSLGLLADERNVGQLTQHLAFLSQHVDLWSEISANARRRVEAEFDARTQGRRLAKIYGELISNRPLAIPLRANRSPPQMGYK